MTRLRSRCGGGARLHDAASGGHWETTTMIAAWRPSAPSAPLRIAAATDTAVFRAYTQHELVPQLQPEPIAESDTLSRHQGTVIRQLIEAAGCRLWLRPPYSPDRNPIKKMWSRIKAFLRAAN